MSCLSEVVLALLANKTLDGGFECDLGGTNDVISPKRYSLWASYWNQHVPKDEQTFTLLWRIWGSQAWLAMGVFYT